MNGYIVGLKMVIIGILLNQIPRYYVYMQDRLG